MINQGVHGLGDTDHSRERDAPRAGVVESAGGGDGDDTEQDGCGKVHGSDVSAGEYTS